MTTAQIVMTAVMVAASAATSAVSVVSANETAAKQRDAADANAKAAADAANNAAALDYLQQGEQQDQTNTQAAQEQTQRAKQALMERASLRVASGESGVAGATVDRLEGDTYMQNSLDAASIETNRSNKVNQIQMEKKATEATANSRGNQALSDSRTTYANSKSTSGWAAGLQIASSTASTGMSTYANVKTLNR